MTGHRLHRRFAVAGAGPAGDYTIEIRPADVIRLRSVASPAVEFDVPVLSRLDEGTSTESKLVFERSGNMQVLSEIWMGEADGYLVDTGKGAEARRTAKGLK